MREHHLIVVLWGERYRNYFLQHCLPSLRMWGNRPPGLNRRLFIACPQEDWDAIGWTLRTNVIDYGLVHYRIDPPGADVVTQRVKHATPHHAQLLKMAFDANAIVTILTPDMMLSDGAMTWAAKQIAEGKHLALAPAMRFADDPLLKTVKSYRPRDLVRAAIASMHSEMVRYNWDFPSIPVTNHAFWWAAPRGMLVHSWSWAMLMMDMSFLKEHSTKVLDDGFPVDAHYVWSNWGDPGPDKVAIATDSDQAFWCSFGPRGEHAHDLTPDGFYEDRRVGELCKGAAMRAVWRRGYDPLRQRLFFHPCFWHAEDLDTRWQGVEKHASFTIRRFLRRATTFTTSRPGSDLEQGVAAKNALQPVVATGKSI